MRLATICVELVTPSMLVPSLIIDVAPPAALRGVSQCDVFGDPPTQLFSRPVMTLLYRIVEVQVTVRPQHPPSLLVPALPRMPAAQASNPRDRLS
jgi:hypothetical protein